MAQDIFERIKQQVEHDRIVLYMKGTPAMPQCGFSHLATEILKRLGVEFASYDVLQDPALREGIKQYSNWPTIPQLYVGGEFVGGSDIMKSLYESGELERMMAAGAVERA